MKELDICLGDDRSSFSIIYSFFFFENRNIERKVGWWEDVRLRFSRFINVFMNTSWYVCVYVEPCAIVALI
jgi:hypothetical protein